jgi:hypothetical protein
MSQEGQYIWDILPMGTQPRPGGSAGVLAQCGQLAPSSSVLEAPGRPGGSVGPCTSQLPLSASLSFFPKDQVGRTGFVVPPFQSEEHSQM